MLWVPLVSGFFKLVGYFTTSCLDSAVLADSFKGSRWLYVFIHMFRVCSLHPQACPHDCLLMLLGERTPA